MKNIVNADFVCTFHRDSEHEFNRHGYSLHVITEGKFKGGFALVSNYWKSPTKIRKRTKKSYAQGGHPGWVKMKNPRFRRAYQIVWIGQACPCTKTTGGVI